MESSVQKIKTSQPYCRACLAPVSTSIGHKDQWELLRCDDCKTVVVEPFPSIEDLTEYYADYNKTHDYLRKKESKIRRVKKRIARILRHNPPGKRFLDVGCSIGYSAASAEPYDLDVTGIDLDGVAIDIATKEFGHLGNFEAITIEDYAERGAQTDIIYAVEVIEHVPNPESFVKAISDLLVTGGLLYITAPDGGHWRVPKKFEDWDMVCPPDHLTYFTRKGLSTLLERHGLKIKNYQVSFKPGIKAIAVKI